MTDYELASLFGEYLSILQDQYINYATVLFAFLLVGYFAAHKLKPVVVTIVVVLFSAYALDSMIAILLVNSDLSDLTALMHERISNGSEDLAFHAGARGDLDVQMAFFRPLRIFALVGGYVGAVFFFFYQRKVGASDGGI